MGIFVSGLSALKASSPCLVFLSAIFLGVPGEGGVHRHNNMVFDDMNRRTGEENCCCVFVMLTCLFLLMTRLQGGSAPPTMTLRVQTRLAAAHLLGRSPSSRRGFPQDILSILFGFSCLVAFFFFLSGWVGFPLPRFPPSPLCLLRFSSSGWVGSPCRVFPAVSPCFCGWIGGRFSFFFLRFLLSLASCIFSLLGLS